MGNLREKFSTSSLMVLTSSFPVNASSKSFIFDPAAFAFKKKKLFLNIIFEDKKKGKEEVKKYLDFKSKLNTLVNIFSNLKEVIFFKVS